jgi:5-(carboxyamino)imidazole ribonucleotide mutase
VKGKEIAFTYGFLCVCTRTDYFLFYLEEAVYPGFLFFNSKGGKYMTVAVIMGSKSDWETMKHACDILDQLEVSYIKKVVSAHRTPDLMFEFAEKARDEGIKVIIAGAGGAAHLPGMVAAKTTLPVIGVPVQSKALNGLDSLLSIVQMPGGVPVATVAIGKAGATNAGLLAAQILGAFDSEVAERLERLREETKTSVMESSDELV